MSALIRLYPRPWRDRYEVEFLGILESRPPSGRDRFDIVLGALDARLHPELPGHPDAPRRSTPLARWAGASAISAGVFYLAWVGLILQEFKGWGGGEPEHAFVGILLSVTASLLLALAHVLLAVVGQPSMLSFGNIGASVAAVSFVFLALGGGLVLVFALIGSAMLAAAMSGRTLPGWLSAFYVGATALLLAVMLAFVAGDGRDVSLLPLMAPFGLAWLLVGFTVVRRGVPEGALATDVSG